MNVREGEAQPSRICSSGSESPSCSLSHDKVQLSIETALAHQDWVGVLQDAIAILESASDKAPAVLILDEFQVVASIGPKGVGGAFKALADQAHKASLVFSGSHPLSWKS